MVGLKKEGIYDSRKRLTCAAENGVPLLVVKLFAPII